MDISVEDEAFETESVLLAGLIDKAGFDALAAVLCSRSLEDGEERLDKVNCTDELYDEEEELANGYCRDEEVVKEPLKEREGEATVDVLFETRLKRDRDEKVLGVNAESSVALELLDTRKIATSASQTVLHRRRENI